MDDEFKEFFEQYGVVVDSVVMYDRETHRSRGFGFVTFQDPEVAKKLLSMGSDGKLNNSEGGGGKKERVGRLIMKNKPCEVKAAEPKESRAPRRPFVPSGGVGMNRFGTGVGMERRSYSMNSMYMPPDHSNGTDMFSMGHPFPPAQGYNPEMPTVMSGGYHVMAPNPGYFPPMVGMGGNPGYAAPIYSSMPGGPPVVQGGGEGHTAAHTAHLPIPPLFGAHMEGTGGGTEGPPAPMPHGYYPPYMSAPPHHHLHPSPPLQQHAQYNQFAFNNMSASQENYSGSGGMLAMHPAAPGLPGRDSNGVSEESTPH